MNGDVVGEGSSGIPLAVVGIGAVRATFQEEALRLKGCEVGERSQSGAKLCHLGAQHPRGKSALIFSWLDFDVTRARWIDRYTSWASVDRKAFGNLYTETKAGQVFGECGGIEGSAG